jgi:1,4-dihydroxy-2-naphthoate octaprenyltransferase
MGIEVIKWLALLVIGFACFFVGPMYSMNKKERSLSRQ